MAIRWKIVGLGEALFDVFADDERLGGAPLNAAVHAHQLLSGRGGQGVVVSRVGQDAPGQRVVAELDQRGLATNYLQADPDRPTGRVYVSTDEAGQPQYDIVEDVAWDWIQFDPDLEDLAARCDAVCFGTLAQRAGQSRSSIQRFVTLARRAFKLFDVNLRQEYYDRQLIDRCLQLSDAAKMNTHEFATVTGLLGLGAQTNTADAAAKAARILLTRYELKYVALTRGQHGTILFTSDNQYEGATPTPPPELEVVTGEQNEQTGDAVGAGDACAAALMAGWVLRLPMQKTADLANAVGAYVASQPGATPPLPEHLLKMVGG